MILIDPDELVTAAETFSSRREPRTVTFAPVRPPPGVTPSAALSASWPPSTRGCATR